jgi:hypothetical protein
MEHVVPRHAGVPFCTVHALPHAPQFCTLFVVAVSQPLATLASQFPNPAAHAMLHAPDVQNATPFVVLHASPHPPQFFALASMFVSHPFDATPSQSAYGAMHDVISHVPVAQLVFAFGRMHCWPQEPQFSEVDSDASQPSCGKPSQSA